MKLKLIYTNDYQDVYRIKDGVFLSVNKFTYTISNNVNRWFTSINSKVYKNHIFYRLCELTKEYKYVNSLGEEVICPVGTVLYDDYPVKKIDSKEEWNYEIEVTREHAFSGDARTMNDILMETKKLITEISNLYN